jgi:tRNA threonylcarbamoyladenosine biosynthesis protein TsaB
MHSASTRLLAIDTSTRTVGLALYDGTQVLAESTWVSHDHHTVELAPAVAEALKKCGLSAADLGALAVATGPGSFTGLRIGMALAKGIALVQHIPLIGIPSLDILAASQPPADLPLVALLRTGRGRLAAGWYLCGKENRGDKENRGGKEDRAQEDRWQPASQVEVLTPQDLAQRIHTPTLVCGELTAEERQLLARKHKNVILASPALSLRRPSYLAELAWKRWQAGQIDDPASLAPTYLHYSRGSEHNETIPG